MKNLVIAENLTIFESYDVEEAYDFYFEQVYLLNNFEYQENIYILNGLGEEVHLKDRNNILLKDNRYYNQYSTTKFHYDYEYDVWYAL